MKIIATAFCALLVHAADAIALEKGAPTWSEITGARHYLATANRVPAIIKSIDGHVYTGGVMRVGPGKRTIVVQAPHRKTLQGPNKRIVIDIAPCMRYYMNAQFDNSTSAEWKPVVAYVDHIVGCRIGAPAGVPTSPAVPT